MFSDLDCLGAFGAASAGASLPGSFALAAASLERLADSPPLLDPDGLKCSVVRHVVHHEQRCAAWVEWRRDDTRRVERHEYHLCARTPDARLLSREIESCNPYFGVFVDSLRYEDGVVHLVYRDKHATCIAELDETNLVSYRRMSGLQD